jgi:hypothetical protein
VNKKEDKLQMFRNTLQENHGFLQAIQANDTPCGHCPLLQQKIIIIIIMIIMMIILTEGYVYIYIYVCVTLLCLAIPPWFGKRPFPGTNSAALAEL